MSALWSALRDTLKLFGSQRRLWIPFLIAALVEAFLMGLVWLAPHAPFSKLLAPPVRFFYGEHFLHYPLHLWFMVYTIKHAYLASSVLVGAFMTGVACAMVGQIRRGKAPSLREALVSGDVHFGRMVLVWLLSWGMIKAIIGGFGLLTLGAAWMFWGFVGLAIVSQALVVYSIPAAVFDRQVWWKAMLSGVREAARFPFSTLLVVAPPIAAVLAASVALHPTRVQQWMIQSTPEIAVLVLVANLLIWMVSDAFLTITICHLWWAHRRRAAAPVAPSRKMAAPKAKIAAAGAVLGALVAASSLSGCSSNYNGERLLWKAAQVSAPIFNAKDLSRVSPEQIQTALAAHARVIEVEPGSSWAARAQLSIGMLWVAQKDYARAREAYALLFQNYNRYQETVLTARVAIARTYELEKNWDDAVKAYDEIIEYHPWSTLGLEAPIYIGRLYESRKDAERAAKAYERAVRFYTRAVPDAPTPELASQVRGLLALAYQRLKRWDEAIRTLQDVVNEPASPNRAGALVTLGAIYESKLDQPNQAKAAYQQFLAEFPKHPLSKLASQELERLGVPAAKEESLLPGASGDLTGLNAMPSLPTTPTTP